jgi:hypothetical protein
MKEPRHMSDKPEKRKAKTGPKKGVPRPPRETPIDWPAIEGLYRAGLLSITDIARMHGISHVAIVKRAKKHAWVRGADIAEEARRLANSKLAGDKKGAQKQVPPAPAAPKKPDPELPEGWTPPPREQPKEPQHEEPAPPHLGGVDFESIVQNAAGSIVALVRQHRAGLSRLNGFANDLMDRLEGLMPNVRTLGHSYDAAMLFDTLVRSYERVVKLERQAFGVDDPTIKHQHTGPDGNPLPMGVTLEVLNEDDLFALRGVADKMARRRPKQGQN